MTAPKNDKRRQHYVPKFYLRNFSTDKKSFGMYWVDKDKTVVHASINNSLWKEYFYGEDAKVENWFANYEGKWDGIVSRIIQSQKLPHNNNDKVLLRYFILMSSARTARRGDEISQMCTELAKELLREEAPELFNSLTCEQKDNFKINVNPPTLYSIDAARKNLPLTLDLRLCLLKNKSKIDFITSDNPVVYYNQLYRERNLTRGFGWVSHGIQFIIPISPRLAVCMYDPETYKLRQTILRSESVVNNLNKLFAANSDKALIFMHNDSSAGNVTPEYVRKLAKCRPEFLDKRNYNSIICFSNTQAEGKYDLSAIFAIRKRFREMQINDIGEKEVAEKLEAEILKLTDKLQAMNYAERQALIQNKKSELLEVHFDDMERPWPKFFKEHEAEIIAYHNCISMHPKLQRCFSLHK